MKIAGNGLRRGCGAFVFNLTGGDVFLNRHNE
jgi:hypothetical protein